MKLIVNGEERTTMKTTVLELLQELGIEEKVMAAAVNMEVVKKENWATYSFNEGDKVEFLHFVGGG